jgi:hypothetical protein
MIVQFEERTLNIIPGQFRAVPADDHDFRVAVVHQISDGLLQAFGEGRTRLGMDIGPGKAGPKIFNRRRGREDMDVRTCLGKEPWDL